MFNDVYPFIGWQDMYKHSKCKKTLTKKYSSASDIDNTYTKRVSDDGSMLTCHSA